MKSIYVSDDGKVTTEPIADEQPDVIYDDDGKMQSFSVRILLLMAIGMGRLDKESGISIWTKTASKCLRKYRRH